MQKPRKHPVRHSLDRPGPSVGLRLHRALLSYKPVSQSVASKLQLPSRIFPNIHGGWILLQARTFYTSRYEQSWSARLHDSAQYYDKISEMESFAGSITTSAGLFAVGMVGSASLILNRALSTFPELLVSQHPQLYYVLAELSLDHDTSNPLGRLRSQIKKFAASTALTILGASHPITNLLCLTFPRTTTTSHTFRFRELIQRKIQDLLSTYFNPTSYQATGQYYCFARVLAKLGKRDEARDILVQTVATWEEIYGHDNILPITGLLELTKVHLAANDLSNGTEALILDALQRTMTLLENADSNAKGSTGLVHARMGCLKTLGRLYVLRGDVQNGLMQYTAAANVGVEALGLEAPAVQLALADLDAVRQVVAASERLRVGRQGLKNGSPEERDALVKRLTMTSLSTITNEAIADR